ncbi:energy transducer TonB family protein [Longimicrobium terrae]|uniref:TonB family protein n=1 Tax=Longimicrobium terrae TaxID=1639882 RepID=A0A841H5J9_9BACT|nr:energy transducer TonB [Longimicrobium terrae]MBB4639009.1 TonB family protein [Longimicrobium terrae]MBB6073248.1 TonB family protein [Longimicrobium terrae]NNC32301.1 energy transducer TonB [Longimicrobium terrae]
MKITHALIPALIALASPALLAAQQTAAAPERWQPAPLSAGLDSAQVAAQLAALPATREPRHAWVFSIEYTPEGTVSGVRMFFTPREPASAQAEVARILLAAARPRAAAPDPQPLVVTAVPGPRPLLRVPHETAPVPRNVSAMESALREGAERILRRDSELQGMQVEVRVRMRVNEDGIPIEANAVSPGADYVDQEAVRAAQALRFRPSRVEGRPAAVWVVIPLLLQFP